MARCRQHFNRWLVRCARVAMEDEWIIDPSMPNWRVWFRRGKTPRQAVDRLFKMVRERS